MRQQIEVPADLVPITSFSADTDCTSRDVSPCATPLGCTFIDVIDAGSGTLTVRMAGNSETARNLTVASGDRVEGHIVRVVGDRAAAVLGSESETFALVDGDTLAFSVNGGASDTATFNTGDFSDISAATAAEVATVIAADIANVTASDSSGQVLVTENSDEGTGGTIKVVGGSDNALAVLGFSVGDFDAGGDTDVSRIRIGFPMQ